MAHVDLSVDLMPGERVQITLEAVPGSDQVLVSQQRVARLPAGHPTPRGERRRAADLWQRARAPFSRISIISPQTLFWAGMVIYLLVRLVGIVDFPISFTPNEAIHPLLAERLLSNGLKDGSGEFLPTFFENDGQYSLGASVYFQTVPVLLFGRSLWLTRASVALLSLLAALWCAWMARDHYKLSLWWLAPLVLSSLPAWFLFSRTGYEFALMATFYAGFLYYYLQYRLRHPKFLFPALVLGALTFYAYSAGQFVMLAAGIGLLISDARYHWRQRRIALAGLGLLILLALPLARFWVSHPLEYASRLQQYNLYWTESIGTLAKLGRFMENYLSALNPLYWFLPNDVDPLLYRMQGYAHLTVILLPAVVAGVVLAVRRWRQPEMRLLLVALLAAPAAAAFADLTVQRVLAIVIPATLLTLLALQAGLAQLEKRTAFPRTVTNLLLALAFAAASLLTLTDALTRAPTWSQDYGISGMQWGARQVFAAVRSVNQSQPEQRIFVSPAWSYQVHTLRDFFLPPDAPVEIGSAESHLDTVEPRLSDWLFVVTAEELAKLEQSQRFSEIAIDRTITAPDGKPGFHFIRLTYRDDIEAFLVAEKARRFAPVAAQVIIDQQELQALHSPLDMGELQNVFDGNPDTLMRTSGANPLVVELAFPQRRDLSGLTARVGAEPVRLTVTLTVAGEVEPRVFVAEAGEVDGYKDVAVPFGETLPVTHLRLELLDIHAAEISNVHLWEIVLE